MNQILEELKHAGSKKMLPGDEGKPELSMTELLSGMVRHEFFFHHQPIINLFTDTQIGSEMLIRWARHGEVLAPMWFMSMIERHGLNAELDLYVIERFLEIPWEATVKPDFKYRVFINISAQSFIAPEFIRRVSDAAEKLQRHGIIPVLELSERTSCEIGFIKKHMNDLHSLGIEIALDDFGAGYSSYSRLIELPIDIIKIDRSIISRIGDLERAEVIAHSIFQMAKDLNLKVVAEGVETQTQADWLARYNQCWAQGFYYARPSISGFIHNSFSLVKQGEK